MQAVILAGGRGKRLGVIVRLRPKPMLLIGGHPFLEYLLTWLKEYDIKDIIFCCGYAYSVIEEHFGSGKDFGVNIRYSIENKPLGTAGALHNARHLIDRDFILLNGDSFVDLDLKDMLNYHYKKKNKITMAVVRIDKSGRFGSVEIDNDEKVINFSEKSGKGEYVNAGVYICKNELLKNLPSRYPSSLEKDVFPKIGNGWIGAYQTEKFFIDIGTVSNFHRVKGMTRRLPWIRRRF